MPKNSSQRIVGLYQRLFQGRVERSYFQWKRDQWETLKSAVASDVLQWAFLLPNDAALLREYGRELERLIGGEVLGIKQETLRLLGDEKRLYAATHITDPLHPLSQPVTLLLLEVVASLHQGTLPREVVASSWGAWVTLADHFGLWELRYRLEDAVFALTHPDTFRLLSSLMERHNRVHQHICRDIAEIVRSALARAGLGGAEILYRKKNAYGIYRKMELKNKNINHMTDLLGFRILTESAAACYRVLGVLHALWPHYRRRVKDYIKHPKPNQYQSIHTTLCCLQQFPVEFQIRTRDMDRIAQHGPACHAVYRARARARAHAVI